MGFEETVEVHADHGTSLNVYRRPGPGPSVVFAHGGTDSGRLWERILSKLPVEWDVIAPDARGHGRSGRAPVYRFDDLVSDLARIVQDLGLVGPVLVGASMGAATIASYAGRHPVNSCVVLEDPPWWASETKESLREMFVAWRQNLEALQSDSVEERMAYVREQNPQLSAEVHRAIVEARRTVDPALIEQVGKAIPHWREVVPQIGYPALLVCGNPSKGAIVTPEQALEIHQLNARVEVAMISGAGHATHRDSSDDYVAAIVPFIRRFV